MKPIPYLKSLNKNFIHFADEIFPFRVLTSCHRSIFINCVAIPCEKFCRSALRIINAIIVPSFNVQTAPKLAIARLSIDPLFVFVFHWLSVTDSKSRPFVHSHATCTCCLPIYPHLSIVENRKNCKAIFRFPCETNTLQFPNKMIFSKHLVSKNQKMSTSY